MNKAIIYIILLLLIACNESNKDIVLYPDSTNYEYKKINDTLIKVIRFFPDTKDTSLLYFYNIKKAYKENVSYWFNKNGKIIKKYRYFPYLNKFKGYEYYPNGKIKKEWTVFNNLLINNFINYYYDGQIHKIREFIQLEGKEYVNNVRIYNKNGKLKSDSTYFIELISKRDTVSINDSLL